MKPENIYPIFGKKMKGLTFTMFLVVFLITGLLVVAGLSIWTGSAAEDGSATFTETAESLNNTGSSTVNCSIVCTLCITTDDCDAVDCGGQTCTEYWEHREGAGGPAQPACCNDCSCIAEDECNGCADCEWVGGACTPK